MVGKKRPRPVVASQLGALYSGYGILIPKCFHYEFVVAMHGGSLNRNCLHEIIHVGNHLVSHDCLRCLLVVCVVAVRLGCFTRGCDQQGPVR